LTFTIDSGDMQFNLGFIDTINSTISTNVDLQGSGSLTPASGSGQVNITGQAALNLTAGLNTAANLPASQRFFLDADGSEGFTATLSAKAAYNVAGSAPALTFSAGYGPISVQIKNARVLLNNAQFTATLHDGGDGDQRLTLDEISANFGSD